MSIKFKNREHEKFYEQCLTQTGSLDPYRQALQHGQRCPQVDPEPRPTLH